MKSTNLAKELRPNSLKGSIGWHGESVGCKEEEPHELSLASSKNCINLELYKQNEQIKPKTERPKLKHKTRNALNKNQFKNDDKENVFNGLNTLNHLNSIQNDLVKNMNDAN